jgi:DNA-binding NarL/FixJ family response regulator
LRQNPGGVAEREMNNSESVTVLIADDHPLVRLGMESVLRAQPDMQIVGQAADGDEAVRQVLRLHPDVVVLDVRMPVKDGIEALAEIKEALPAARCLMLTSFDDPEQVLQAIRAGAAGFLHKDAGPDELLRAIRAVYRGEGALNAAATRQLINAYQILEGAESQDVKLTAAEVEVLKLLTKGLSNRELANELGVSVRTISTHVRHILDKLGAQNRVQAALYAREHGLTR